VPLSAHNVASVPDLDPHRCPVCPQNGGGRWWIPSPVVSPSSRLLSSFSRGRLLPAWFTCHCRAPPGSKQSKRKQRFDSPPPSCWGARARATTTNLPGSRGRTALRHAAAGSSRSELTRALLRAQCREQEERRRRRAGNSVLACRPADPSREMRPRRHSYGRGGRSAAAAVLLVLCLCVTGVFLLLLHGSSPPLEAEEGKKEAAAVRSREEALVVQAEVEEAPLPPGNARVAFLFIARNRLPLDLVWDAFFRVRSPMPCPALLSTSNAPMPVWLNPRLIALAVILIRVTMTGGSPSTCTRGRASCSRAPPPAPASSTTGRSTTASRLALAIPTI
jgi:hypothetical protein